jgi:hypothetical protein
VRKGLRNTASWIVGFKPNCKVEKCVTLSPGEGSVEEVLIQAKEKQTDKGAALENGSPGNEKIYKPTVIIGSK